MPQRLEAFASHPTAVGSRGPPSRPSRNGVPSLFPITGEPSNIFVGRTSSQPMPATGRIRLPSSSHLVRSVTVSAVPPERERFIRAPYYSRTTEAYFHPSSVVRTKIAKRGRQISGSASSSSSPILTPRARPERSAKRVSTAGKRYSLTKAKGEELARRANGLVDNPSMRGAGLTRAQSWGSDTTPGENGSQPCADMEWEALIKSDTTRIVPATFCPMPAHLMTSPRKTSPKWSNMLSAFRRGSTS